MILRSILALNQLLKRSKHYIRKIRQNINYNKSFLRHFCKNSIFFWKKYKYNLKRHNKNKRNLKEMQLVDKNTEKLRVIKEYLTYGDENEFIKFNNLPLFDGDKFLGCF